ncbi:MAG: preprotein translocase subunit SecG [Armatimonadota bacterium]|nr:preprotein translocase subunit SecG [Armatimonadota bacterium]
MLELFSFKNILIFINIATSLILIAIVMSQTTKSEGLSGTIGGKAQSSFRGKPGMDDKLNLWTKYAAVGWMVTSLIVAYVHMAR